MDALGSRKSKILLIEDNSGDVELLQLALQHADVEYEMVVFQRGGEALAYIGAYGSANDGEEPPDLAIVDLNLPQNSGLEIIEAMRGTARLAAVPVAVFSSSSLPGERARLEALQMTRYITKPVDLDELLKVGMSLKRMLMETPGSEIATGTV